MTPSIVSGRSDWRKTPDFILWFNDYAEKFTHTLNFEQLYIISWSSGHFLLHLVILIIVYMNNRSDNQTTSIISQTSIGGKNTKEAIAGNRTQDSWL